MTPWIHLLSIALLAAACGSTGSSAASAEGSTGTPATDAEGGSAGDSTGAPADGTGGALYHPVGFSGAAMHGGAMKMQAEDCRGCHGEDLMGGSSGIGCDSCHTPDWRTDCVFCHGGENEPSGAPPRDLDGTSEMSMLSFIAHGRHVTQYQHEPYDCAQCHAKPVDVLSVGHIFDDTPAVAEVDFSAGLSPAAVWDGDGGCSSLYCHGNGRTSAGTYQHDQSTPSCGGCHPYPSTENTAYNTMSGQHARHIGEGISCADCHDPLAITSHVDGKPDVAIAPTGITYDAAAGSCTGLCHLKPHNEHW